MKKTIFIICFFLAAQANAQVAYVPFDFESSRWSENSYSVWFSRSFYDVFVDGDTIINNATYYKLRKEGITYFYDSPSQSEITDSSIINGYIGAIKENDQKQIEFLSSNQIDPIVIYDFNIATGDTIEVFDASLGQVTAVVSSMDTIEYCGALRNRYTLLFPDWLPFPAYLIEGIGSENGIIPTFELFESAARLDCYSKDNCDCGDIINNTNQPDKTKSEFSISPNPAKEELSIHSISGTPINTLRIFNIYGQQVFETKVNQTQISINSSFLSNGSYFINLSGSDWNYTQMILILH